MQAQRAPDLPTIVARDISDPSRLAQVFTRLYVALTTMFYSVFDVVNRGIEVNNMLKYEGTIADTGTANSENTVSHNLGFIPTVLILTYSDRAASLYHSGTTWTTTQAFIKASVANASVRFLIMR